MKIVTAAVGCRSSVASLKWIGTIMAENSASMVFQISSDEMICLVSVMIKL